MKLLLFGKNGQLGWELHRTLVALGEVTAVDYPEVDFSEPNMIRDVIRQVKPDVIVNAAAYTDVDRAERESNKVFLVNAEVPGLIAKEAIEVDSAFVHFSTDYVFDGKKGSDYIEEDSPNPINVYGSSKLEGERLVCTSGSNYLVFRTSWVYSLRQGGFVNKVLAWSHSNDVIRIVDDQVGSPTWARSLAILTTRVLLQAKNDMNGFFSEKRGLYHLAGRGSVSRFAWSEKIIEFDSELNGRSAIKILPAKSAEFSTAAQRPLYSGLNCDRFMKVFGIQIPAWDEVLKQAMSSTNKLL